MSSWVNALTMEQCNEALADTYDLDAKLTGVWQRLVCFLRKNGSIPFVERRLAMVAGVTKAYWVKTAWPTFEALFQVSDGRLYHPEIRGLRGQGSYPPDTGNEQRRQAARVAANARWNGRSNLAVVSAEDARSDAIASESHTGNDAISMTSAYGSDAISASGDVADRIPGASSGPLAPSLSQQEDSLSEGSKIQRESLGERESAREREPMRSDAISDAAAHANASDGDAAAHLSSRHSKPRRGPIPRDWQPSEEGEAAARRKGLDPAQVGENFRNWYLGNGELMADWDARFLIWIEREREQDTSRRQGHMTMPIVPLSEPEQVLRKRLTDVAMLRTRTSVAPLAPQFDRLRDAGPSGAAWLDTIEAWANGGFRGEPPPSFDDFLSAA